MKKGLILGLLAALLAFGAGAYLGRSTKQDLMISSSTSGASYSGGFKAESEGAGAATADRRDQIGGRSGADEHRGRERRRVDPGGDQGGAEGNHRPRDAGHVSRDRVHR